MAWKLTEVPDDDDEALSDWELLGVKVSLQASAQGETEGVNVFGPIWGKLWPYFARAINNEHRRDREESVP
jgi:hypothetical protein